MNTCRDYSGLAIAYAACITRNTFLQMLKSFGGSVRSEKLHIRAPLETTQVPVTCSRVAVPIWMSVRGSFVPRAHRSRAGEM